MPEARAVLELVDQCPWQVLRGAFPVIVIEGLDATGERLSLWLWQRQGQQVPGQTGPAPENCTESAGPGSPWPSRRSWGCDAETQEPFGGRPGAGH